MQPGFFNSKKVKLLALTLLATSTLAFGKGALRPENDDAQSVGSDPQANIGSSVTNPTTTADVSSQRAPTASDNKNMPPATPSPRAGNVPQSVATASPNNGKQAPGDTGRSDVGGVVRTEKTPGTTRFDGDLRAPASSGEEILGQKPDYTKDENRDGVDLSPQRRDSKRSSGR